MESIAELRNAQWGNISLDLRDSESSYEYRIPEDR